MGRRGRWVQGPTHRRMMWMLANDCSALRWHGFAHAAANLQALCPTAGLGCCANRKEGTELGGGRKAGSLMSMEKRAP